MVRLSASVMVALCVVAWTACEQQVMKPPPVGAGYLTHPLPNGVLYVYDSLPLALVLQIPEGFLIAGRGTTVGALPHQHILYFLPEGYESLEELSSDTVVVTASAGEPVTVAGAPMAPPGGLAVVDFAAGDGAGTPPVEQPARVDDSRVLSPANREAVRRALRLDPRLATLAQPPL